MKSNIEGWNKTQIVVPTKEYNLALNSTHEINEMEVKHQFAHEFVKKFFEDNIITIHQQKNPYTLNIQYEAKMTVAEQGITNMVRSGREFNAFGRVWTEEEILKAIRESFPEYLI